MGKAVLPAGSGHQVKGTEFSVLVIVEVMRFIRHPTGKTEAFGYMSRYGRERTVLAMKG